MSTRYEKFLPEVLPFAHDCPEPVAINAVRNACIEFCDKSMWLQFEHPDIITTAGISRYDLRLPLFTQSARIIDAWHNEYPVAPKSDDELRAMYGFDWRDATGNPRYITHLVPGELITVPMLEGGSPNGVLKLIVALRPTRDSIDVDDTIYERWLEVIGQGARGRLHAITNQPFSDPTAAVQTRVAFSNGIAQASRERSRGMGRGITRVRPVRVP